ncbi:MAG: ABC transporter permease subunit [Oscillospiraceae bacterium]|nr:ABC transporter permease subunit [Oscillospiraceae bacterium]
MLAIFKREIGSYFNSAIGYAYLAVFYFFSGLYLFLTSLAYNSSNLSGVFGSLITISMFLVPILTMKLISEERKQKTDQALLTSPIKLSSIVIGKFFAGLFIYVLGILITVVYAITLSFYAPMEWTVIIGNVLGIILLGGALISIGVFVSSTTESQVISAIVSFAIMMFLFFSDGFFQNITNPTIKEFFVQMSFFTRFQDFTIGIIDISNIIFFISFIVVFNFLTVRTLEKRRWR